MKDEYTKEQTDAILKALDEAIEAGPWEESNFLRVIGKNLREIRNNFINQLRNNEGTDKETQAKAAAPRPGYQEVFVSLYSSNGSSLQSWERILANLPNQMISRPIYEDEENIKKLIKTKENKFNEAYVGIYINQADILMMAPDKIPLDKLGKPLMSLKDRSLSLENITCFVHISGNYLYFKGRLIKNDSE